MSHTIEMLSPFDNQALTHYAGHRSAVTALAFQANGELLVSGDVDRHICVWGGGNLRWSRPLRGGQTWTKARAALRMLSLACSPSGRRLFTAGNERLEAMSLLNGSYEWSYQSPRLWGFLVTLPLCVAVSEYGRVAACFENATLGIWNEEGKLECMLQGNDMPDRIGFLSGGRLLAGIGAFRLSVFDTETGEMVARFDGRNRFIAMAVHPVLPFVACRSLESVFIFDPLTGKSRGGFSAGYGLPLLSFRPLDKSLAVANLDQVSIKDFEGRTLQSFNLSGRRCTSLAWHPMGGQLAIGCSDGDLLTLNVA